MNGLRTFLTLEETDEAVNLQHQYLLWLLDRDPDSLSVNQRRIREMQIELLIRIFS